jgi:hypothetical protein
VADRTLTVRVIGDDRSLQQTFARSEAGAKRFERSVDSANLRTQALGQGLRGALSQTGGPAGGLLFGSAAFVGTAIATAAITKSVKAASDLNEQITKSKAIFQDSAAEIRSWSETTAERLGISQRAALEASGTFGNLFKAIGIGNEQNAELSKSLVQLASDLASFNNANPEDVLLALRSGLVGEAEPLRKFGVQLSEARVQQQALTDTGKQHAAELTNQEKALARYEIIMADTSAAQGDFARTSGGVANQTRILQANIEDVSAEFGSAFLPAVGAGIQGLNDFFAATQHAIHGLHDFREALKDSHFADGFNEKVDEGAGFVSNLGLAFRDSIPFINDWRDAITGAGEAIPTPGTNAFPVGSNPAMAGLQAAAQAAIDASAAGDAAQRQSARAFSAHLKGLGLKLDKAQVDSDTRNDLAVLNEIIASIERRERAVGKTFELEQSLTQFRSQRARILDQQDAEAAAAEKKTSDNAAKRRADAKARAQAARRAAAADRQGDQFELLGLSREGDERTPSSKALAKRANRLEDQIKGTVLDTAQTRRELDHIEAVLAGKFGEVGRNVRRAIQSMLNDINTALHGDSGDRKGPLTAFRVANFSEIRKQFPSLSPDDADRLRQILSRRGAGGTIAQGSSVGGAFGVDKTRADEGRTNVFHITVEIDGKAVAHAVANETEKKSQRRSGQRSGVRPGARR